jgi:ornithine--oxo-acid transaminase
MSNVGPVSPSGKEIRFGDIDDVRAAFDVDGKRLAAIMLEPIQGSAG